jgi:cobalt-precorrin 5A hydrolase/precorrin-3B C17-methyltransferase
MNELFSQFQPLKAIAVTRTTAKQIQPLCKEIGAKLWTPEKAKINNCFVYTVSLKEHLTHHWHQYKAIIFSLTIGAVVRLIAPLLENKETDPAIIVIDPQAKYVISLCGGHQGGADHLAQLIAYQIEATPIITSTSDYLNLPAIDLLGNPYGWRKGEGDWTEVSASIARGEKVLVIQDAGSTLWQNSLPSCHPFDFTSSQNLSKLHTIPPAIVFISAKKNILSSYSLPTVQWHPRVLWVGIGCERGIGKKLIEFAIEQVFSQFNLALLAIAGIATIDIKADEKGILAVCQEGNFPLKTFTAQQLSQIKVPNPSQIVLQEVKTPSVAEAAAIKASQTENLLVSKQIIKLDGEKGAVTVAVAQSNLEYTGRGGKIYLVGIGPGSLSQITPAAKTAIGQADAIIGYSLYLELISSLCRPGQIIEPFPITQEKQRAERAIELAQWGLTVAVVSSGDCGIYGMAGLVLETICDGGWDGKKPTVKVFPGITAMQAAAAKLGAPLMHDFCAISLSDLLTPWNVIEKRIIAAASADFVTAIYNPKSKTRTEQIVKTQEIFRQYRNKNTPVAIVNSVDREGEQIIVTTLEEMLNFPIDMLTTLIIGNSHTRKYENWMITPRGYQS